MTPEKVRQNFYTRIEISDPDEAKKLSKVITGQKFEPIPRPNVMDVRLVVDLTMEDGSVHSYVADKFRIYAPDNVSSARINDEFKDRFRIGRQRVK